MAFAANLVMALFGASAGNRYNYAFYLMDRVGITVEREDAHYKPYAGEFEDASHLCHMYVLFLIVNILSDSQMSQGFHSFLPSSSISTLSLVVFTVQSSL